MVEIPAWYEPEFEGNELLFFIPYKPAEFHGVYVLVVGDPIDGFTVYKTMADVRNRTELCSGRGDTLYKAGVKFGETTEIKLNIN